MSAHYSGYDALLNPRNSHLASYYYTDMTPLSSLSYYPFTWPSGLPWYALAPPAPQPYGQTHPWHSNIVKPRPTPPAVTAQTPTWTTASPPSSTSSTPELVHHVVCTAPLVAPVPVPRARPALFECELPDIDEDLSHPPYVTRPGKRKSSDVLVDVQVLPSPVTLPREDLDADGGGRPRKQRRIMRAPLAPRTERSSRGRQ